jgi:hypothetical protein
MKDQTELCERVIRAEKRGGFTIYTKDDVVRLAESYLELKKENEEIKKNRR